MFLTFARTQTELLAKSDFNTRTCLLAGKLFEYSFFVQTMDESSRDVERRWSQALRAYINTQTLLLAKLKYKHVKDSLLFFGTYYETMAQVHY